MSFLRRSLLGILALALTFLLFAFAANYNALKIVGNSDSIKELLATSGIYNSIVPSLLSSAGKDNNSDINFNDPIVQNAAAKAFNGQFMQTQTEGIIDGVYKWLNGDTPQPQFKADFGKAKIKFANEVATDVAKRASKLPRCRTFSFQPVNAFSAKCLPYGVTPAEVANNVRRQILSNDGFLKDPVIAPNSFKSGDSQQSIFESKLKNVPSYFQKMKAAPFVLGILIILLAAGVIYGSQTKVYGVRHVGIIFLTSGLMLLFMGWSINKVATERLSPNLKIDNASLQSETRTLIIEAANKFSNNFWTLGGIYSAAGAAAVGGTIYHMRRQPPVVNLTKKAPKPAKAGK